MRNMLIVSFGALIFVSVMVWLAGILAGSIVPLFGGVSAERLGEIGFTVGMIGEGCSHLFGWLRGRIVRTLEKHDGAKVNPPDTGRGRFIPTTSVDQFFAELALWLGVNRGDLPEVLPNIGNFYSPNSATSPLGFLL